MFKKHRNTFMFPLLFLVSTSIHASDFHQPTQDFKTTYGFAAVTRLNDLNNFISLNTSASNEYKVQLVNQYINAFSFASDRLLWGVEDYWEQPLQFIGLGGGDCEDFALMKYTILLKMKVPKTHLKLDYVKLSQTNTDHMVLLYSDSDDTPIDDWLVLNNSTNEIHSLKQQANMISVYFFNENDLKHFSRSPQTSITREMLIKFYNYLNKNHLKKPPANPLQRLIDAANNN